MKYTAIILLLAVPVTIALFSSSHTTTVKTYPELIAALSKASSGDTIKIDGKIAIVSNTVVPGGVILSGGTFYSDSMYPGDQYRAMLVTGGPNVTIKGVVMIGPNGDILDHDTSAGYACAIRNNYPGLTVDSCLFKNWDKWGIFLYVQDKCVIKNSEFEFIRRAGYGYGIWTGGSGSEQYGSCLIENNRFNYCRAAIDGSGHLNSYAFINNWIGRNQLYYNVKRHPSGAKNYFGGLSTRVENNVFLSTQQHFELPYPQDTGITKVTYNCFTRKDCDTFAPAGMIGGRLYWTIDTHNVIVKGNYFNGQGMNLPTAILKYDKDSVRVGGTVKFEANPSSGYIWRFGYGKADGNEQRVRKYNMVYSFPGIYTASLAVVNSENKQSKNVFKTIRVYPATGTWLTFNIKDNYNSNKSGYAIKQVFIDSVLVWSDDVAGVEGWQKVSISCDSLKHTIHFRLACKSPQTDPLKTEVYMWIDDVAICSTTSMTGYDFEGPSLPPGWRQQFSPASVCPGQAVSTAITTEDCRSGEQSIRIRFPFGSKACSGLYGEFNLTTK